MPAGASERRPAGRQKQSAVLTLSRRSPLPDIPRLVAVPPSPTPRPFAYAASSASAVHASATSLSARGHSDPASAAAQPQPPPSAHHHLARSPSRPAVAARAPPARAGWLFGISHPAATPPPPRVASNHQPPLSHPGWLVGGCSSPATVLLGYVSGHHKSVLRVMRKGSGTTSPLLDKGRGSLTTHDMHMPRFVVHACVGSKSLLGSRFSP